MGQRTRALILLGALGCGGGAGEPPPPPPPTPIKLPPIDAAVVVHGSATFDGQTLDEQYCGAVRGLDGEAIGWMARFGATKPHTTGRGFGLYATPDSKTKKLTAMFSMFDDGSENAGGTPVDIVLEDRGHRGHAELRIGAADFHCAPTDDTALEPRPPRPLPTAPGTAWFVDLFGGVFVYDHVTCSHRDGDDALEVVTPFGDREMWATIVGTKLEDLHARWLETVGGWSSKYGAAPDPDDDPRVILAPPHYEIDMFSRKTKRAYERIGFTCPTP